MEPVKIIEKYYTPGTKSYEILVRHSKKVRQKATEVARRVNADVQFVEEAAMLHDIGIFLTNAPSIGCHGPSEYIEHGYLGRELLDEEGFPKHALVAERHTGVGITKKEIEKENLPLPRRDMVPKSIEEEIVCYADKFYSKDPEQNHRLFNIDEIQERLSKFGEDKVKKFMKWHKKFS